MINTSSRRQNSGEVTKSVAFDVVLRNDHIFKCKLNTMDILGGKHDMYHHNTHLLYPLSEYQPIK